LKFLYNGEWDGPTHPHGSALDFVDEHRGSKDVSSLYHQYDSIDPASKRICVAEFAYSTSGNVGNVIGNFEDALADGAFMLGAEKNSERLWWTGYSNYAGLVGHANWGPCMVWNDAVRSFVAPAYYMEKMLFVDNSGTRVLPFTQNTTRCFWSSSIDTASGRNDVLLKVVNNSGVAETVNVNLKGAAKVNPAGHSTTMTSSPQAENSLANPNKVTPLAGTFVAGASFQYRFPAYSMTVLRIGFSK
jgi:alpha-N-arabinofuranosidase